MESSCYREAQTVAEGLLLLGKRLQGAKAGKGTKILILIHADQYLFIKRDHCIALWAVQHPSMTPSMVIFLVLRCRCKLVVRVLLRCYYCLLQRAGSNGSQDSVWHLSVASSLFGGPFLSPPSAPSMHLS